MSYLTIWWIVGCVISVVSLIRLRNASVAASSFGLRDYIISRGLFSAICIMHMLPGIQWIMMVAVAFHAKDVWDIVGLPDRKASRLDRMVQWLNAPIGPVDKKQDNG